MSDEDDLLTIYTIYDHPLDHLESFVVVRWVITKESDAPVRYSEICFDTIEQARGYIPPYCVNLGRELLDDPAIMESWV